MSAPETDKPAQYHGCKWCSFHLRTDDKAEWIRAYAGHVDAAHPTEAWFIRRWRRRWAATR